MTGDYRHVITFQSKTTDVDVEGNEVEVWDDYYKCHAYVNNAKPGSTGISSETYGGDIRRENATDTVLFRVRYCKKVSVVNPYEYQILFDGRQYEIKSLADDVKYLHNEIRFRAVAKDV
jgi:SPP1 family predicted phage head-tail adaptor